MNGPLDDGLLSRRDLLWYGSVGVGASLWPGIAGAGASGFVPSETKKAESVIFLWMGGGVTQLESFDPKPEAPEEIRGTLGAISTSLPGVQFGEVMTELSRRADDLCVVRSFSHDSNDHLLSQAYTLSGRKVTQAQLFSEPNIGSIASYLYGPRNGLPGYIAVPGITRPGPPPYMLFVGGWLGNGYAPFCVGGLPEQPDFTVGEKSADPSPLFEEDLQPRELLPPKGLTSNRLGQRLSLKQQIDDTLRQLDRSNREQVMGAQYENAVHLLTAPEVRSAFDVTQESEATRDRYGRTKIGKRCLLARRLVESGARFVMVDYGYDPEYGNLWDIHNVPEQKFPHVSEMVKRGYNLAGVDRAFAGLIGDLKERGMLEKTLVVYLTEFGRTPQINKGGGRDHWGMCGSIFFAGAGVSAGTVIGGSDKQAAYPTSQPYSPADVAATIYEALGIPLDTRVPDMQGRPHSVLETGASIPGVLT
jgi:hypothetical protein